MSQLTIKFTVSSKDLKDVLDVLSPEDVKDIQAGDMERLANGYKLPKFINNGFSRDEYLKWLQDESVGDLRRKLSVLQDACD